MQRMSLITAIVLAMVLTTGAAWAHCGSCGVGDSPEAVDPHAGHDHGAHGAEGAHGEMAFTGCPGCGMDGGMCAACAPTAEGILQEMAVEFCPDCESTDGLCEMCTMGVNGAMDLLVSFAPKMIEAPSHQVAYVEGTMMGDIHALFGELMGAASEQGLVNEQTYVGGIYPDALSGGFSPDSTYYAGISVSEDAEVAAPLMVTEIPAGHYLVVDHYGAYEELGSSWMATFAWAKMAGVEFGTGPCGEHYVSDPESTPAEEVLTTIYIPLAGMADGHGEA